VRRAHWSRVTAPPHHPAFWPAWAETARHGLHVLSRHTGVPIALLAAVALVLSYRLVRRTWRLALEVCLCATVLAMLTEWRWIAW